MTAEIREIFNWVLHDNFFVNLQNLIRIQVIWDKIWEIIVLIYF